MGVVCFADASSCATRCSKSLTRFRSSAMSLVLSCESGAESSADKGCPQAISTIRATARIIFGSPYSSWKVGLCDRTTRFNRRRPRTLGFRTDLTRRSVAIDKFCRNDSGFGLRLQPSSLHTNTARAEIRVHAVRVSGYGVVDQRNEHPRVYPSGDKYRGSFGRSSPLPKNSDRWNSHASHGSHSFEILFSLVRFALGEVGPHDDQPLRCCNSLVDFRGVPDMLLQSLAFRTRV